MRPLLNLPLARPSLDPDTTSRADTSLLPRLMREETTLVVSMDETGRAALAGERLAYFAAREWRQNPTNLWAYLGKRDDGAAIVLSVGGSSEELTERLNGDGHSHAEPISFADIRTVAAHLNVDDRGVAIPALALANWHRFHQFCPRCGNATEAISSGWVRRCRACSAEHFPRMDPAVIMSVIDAEDRLLLARAAHFAARRYSTIAGYVEPGENLEHAVARETFEETGLLVRNIEYRGSQPWPFPRSLMFAFTARVEGTPAPRVDGIELLEACFFTRDELRAAIVSGDLIPPGGASVAYALVEDWYGDTLPRSPHSWL